MDERTWYRVKAIKSPAYRSAKFLLSFSMYLWPSAYGTNSSSNAFSNKVEVDVDSTEECPATGRKTLKDLFTSESAGERGTKAGSS